MDLLSNLLVQKILGLFAYDACICELSYESQEILSIHVDTLNHIEIYISVFQIKFPFEIWENYSTIKIY